MKGRKLVTKCLIIFAFHNNHVTAIRKRIFFPKKKNSCKRKPSLQLYSGSKRFF